MTRLGCRKSGKCSFQGSYMPVYNLRCSVKMKTRQWVLGDTLRSQLHVKQITYVILELEPLSTVHWRNSNHPYPALHDLALPLFFLPAVMSLILSCSSYPSSVFPWRGYPCHPLTPVASVIVIILFVFLFYPLPHYNVSSIRKGPHWFCSLKCRHLNYSAGYM